MRIIFRYDDFSASQAIALSTDQRVFELFCRHQVPLLVGVTPCMARSVHDPENIIYDRLEMAPARIALLRDGLKEGWQLALHGFSHQRTRSRMSEFEGEPHSVQGEKIRNGLGTLRECFPGTPVEVFIPPWDSFDETTLQCLQENVVRVLCGGFGNSIGAGQGGKQSSEVAVVSSLLETLGFVDYVLNYSVEDLARVVGPAWLVVTMHGYDFDGTRPRCYVPLDEMGDVLRKVKESSVEAGTIPIGAMPVPLSPWQESVLKGKVLLCRRSLIKPLLSHRRYQGSDNALTQICDGIAYLAWKMRRHLKAAF